MKKKPRTLDDLVTIALTAAKSRRVATSLVSKNDHVAVIEVTDQGVTKNYNVYRDVLTDHDPRQHVINHLDQLLNRPSI